MNVRFPLPLWGNERKVRLQDLPEIVEAEREETKGAIPTNQHVYYKRFLGT